MSKQEEVQRLSIDSRQLAEFHYVYPSLSLFNFRDKRLWALDLVSNFDLGQRGLHPGLLEPPKELRVTTTIAGVLQDGWIMASRALISQNRILLRRSCWCRDMIDVTCPMCGEVYHADPVHTGKRIQCRRCGSLVPILAARGHNPPTDARNPRGRTAFAAGHATQSGTSQPAQKLLDLWLRCCRGCHWRGSCESAVVFQHRHTRGPCFRQEWSRISRLFSGWISNTRTSYSQSL